MWESLYQLFIAILDFFYRFTGNYGVAILMLTLLFRIVTYPLTQKSAKAMKAMQRYQPQIKEIQQKYKGDQKKIQQEMMKLYKEHGFNPMAGCLPMALQLPIFIILFNVLKFPDINNYMFTNSYFLGLNLTAQAYNTAGGRFLSDLHLALPGMINIFGDIYIYLPSLILVALMGVSTFFMQKLMTPDPSQAKQMIFMNVFMVIIGATIPNGVLLYWVSSNLMHMGQQWLVERRGVEAVPAKAQTPGSRAAGRSGPAAKPSPPKVTAVEPPNRAPEKPGKPGKSSQSKSKPAPGKSGAVSGNKKKKQKRQ